MNQELKQYAASFENEVLAYEQLERKEFIQQYIVSNYTWESDEEDVMIQEYFDPLEIQHYRNEPSEQNYFEITLGFGWPNIYLNVNSRWESVEYIISWGWESYRKDLSHLYSTISQVYALDCY